MQQAQRDGEGEKSDNRWMTGESMSCNGLQGSIFCLSGRWMFDMETLQRFGIHRFCSLSRVLLIVTSMIIPRFLVIWIAFSACGFAGWTPIQFTNPELREKGTLTGDGCQWVRSIAVDGKDGNFMIWGTDVGGLFRSLDGGKNWEPANVGFDSRGTSGAAIDPKNPDRAVVIAANSVADPRNGIYLTSDRGASWKQVHSETMGAGQDRRVQVAYDASSYDAEAGLTRVLYWSTLSKDKPAWGRSRLKPGFYKSEDGGESWDKIPGGEVVADAYLAVHPIDGTVFAANPEGVRLSTDGGKSWKLVLEGMTTGLTLSPARPDTLYVTLEDGVWRSEDRGETWVELESSQSLARKGAQLRNITASPANPDYLVLWREGENWDWPRFYSHDGGVTWGRAEIDPSYVIVPTNARHGHFAFHPTNPEILLSSGGDYPTLSVDGGRTYRLAGNGVNNLFVGSPFNFSEINPDVLLLASQDYASLLTVDGGNNWKYIEPLPKGWGGFNYAGFAASADTLVVGDNEGWHTPTKRMVSHDGGTTWQRSDDLIKPQISYGDPQNVDVVFAGNYRSADGGKTWAPMTDVSGVYAHNNANGHLFGIHTDKDKKSDSVVFSADHGETWTPLFSSPYRISDIAVDAQRRRIYIATEAGLKAWEKGELLAFDNLPHDQAGPPRVSSVAVDPVDPDILYVAGNRNAFASSASASMSRDAGTTWTNLNRSTPLGGEDADGGRESQWVRVHPTTREPWFATGCYGIWKYSAPAETAVQAQTGEE